MPFPRRLIVAAVAAAMAPALSAQTSNVVLSGQLKLGYEWFSPDGADKTYFIAGPNAGSEAGNSFNVSRVTNATSFVRLSGSEDLGQGLRAVFQIESDVNGDTQGGTWASRNTAVGLSSNVLGTIQFGRWDVHYNSEDLVERAGTGANALQNGIKTRNLMNTVNGIGKAGDRYDNLIRYVSPTWAGFSFVGAYSFDSESTTAAARSSSWQIYPQFASGGFTAFASYMQRLNQQQPTLQLNGTANCLVVGSATCTPVFTSLGAANSANGASNNNGNFDLTGLRVGASYRLPLAGWAFTAGVIWDWTTWEFTQQVNARTTSTYNANRQTWSIPLQASFGPHTLFASWAIALDARGNLDNLQVARNATNAPTGFIPVRITGGGTGATQWAVGYDYAMSKRTSVGLGYIVLLNDEWGRYDYWSRGVTGSATAPQANPGKDISSLYIGMRHLF